MTKDNYKLAAALLVGIAVVMAFKTGPDLLQMSGRPSAEQLSTIIAAIGAAFAAWKGKSDAGGRGEKRADSMDILEALRRLVEQFRPNGLPDDGQIVVTWNGRSYRLTWEVLPKPEPKPEPKS